MIALAPAVLALATVQAAPIGPVPPTPVEASGTVGNAQALEPQQKQPGGTAAEPPASSRNGGDIIIRGRKPRGSVASEIPPERSFNNLDVRAYGAANIEELLQALGPQVTTGRGRADDGPIVLLNGKRVSSLAEISRIPTEAVERMDVFPAEVALAYGYRADQKVVNVVTFQRLSSKIAQLTYTRPTEGARDTPGASADFLRIRGDTRLGLGADYTRSGALLESDRGVKQVGGAGANAGRFRSLLPLTERGTVNGTISGSVFSGVASTVNARFQADSENALFGLGLEGALTSDTANRIVHAGTTHAGRLGDWLWTLTGNLDRTSTTTRTDRLDGGRDDAQVVDLSGEADVLFTGQVVDLPAGAVTASVRGGVGTRNFASRSLVFGVASRADLSRDSGSVDGSVDLPITVKSRWGRLSVNGNARLEKLTGFGDLRTFGYGLRWSPKANLDLRVSVTNEQAAPTVEQQGGPTIATPGVLVFDGARGEAAAVTRVLGGNMDLRADDRHVFSAGVSAKPLGRELAINVDYFDTRIDDPIVAFPLLTPLIEATYPERFTRDADGRLLRIDSRPINFLRSRQRQLRTGLNWSRALGTIPAELRNADIVFAPSEPEPKRNLPPGTTVQRFEANSPQARLFQNLSSRLFVNVQHIWRLEDQVMIRNGMPALDLLGGDAIDGRGGRPRHEIEVQAGAFKRGLGARFTVDWQSGTGVNGLAPTVANPGGRLEFGSVTTASLFLFANLGDHLGRARAPAWLRGTRATLGVTNLFDVRPAVRDGDGLTPLTYQPAFLNPLGRLVSLSFRKVF